jgi:hypothetical protein
LGNIKPYLLGALGGALPAVVVWLLGAPLDVVGPVLVGGVIIGEIVGAAVVDWGQIK